jgi:hypothetical protein
LYGSEASARINPMKQKSTLKLKVVFTCTDLKTSAEDAFELYSQLDGLLKTFRPKSRLDTKEISISNSNPIPQLAAHLKRLQKLQDKSSRSQKKLN